MLAFPRFILAASLAALALPAAADATVYHADTSAELVAALNASDSSPDDDDILIAPGTYQGPFSYTPSIADAGRLTVLGEDIVDTVLTAGGGNGVKVLDLNVDTARNPLTVVYLSVVTPPTGTQTTGIETYGEVTNVRVTRSPGAAANSYTTGVRLLGQSTLKGGQIRIQPGGGYSQTAVDVGAGSSGDLEAVIEDSVLEGDFGIFAGAPVHVMRSRVRTYREGITNCVTNVRVDSVLVEVAAAGAYGLETHSGQCGGATEGATTNARHLTIHNVSGGADARAAVCAANYVATSVDVNLASSIATGFQTPLELVEGGSCTIRVRDSDIPLAPFASSGSGSGTVEDQGGNIVADPAYRDAAASDYHLLPGSPAVDAGGAQPLDPLVESWTDLDREPRLIDGNGDGVLRRDMGAYEAPTTLPSPPPPPSGDGGGGASQPPAGAPPAARDTTAPSLSGVRFAPSAFRVRGRRRGSTLRFQLSEPATVTATLERARSGRRVRGRCRSRGRGARCTRYVAAGTLTLRGAAGANAVKFAGRVSGRTLARGRYRLRLRARDAAGNRSAERAVSFRVRGR